MTVQTDTDTCTAPASVNNGSYDPDGDPIIIEQSPIGPYALGTTDVDLTVADDKGLSNTCTTTVTVVDQTTPEISLTVSPDIFWPPNHKMVAISPTVTAIDNCDLAPAIRLKSITMNEGEEANTYDPNHDSNTGDGNTTGDIKIDSDGNIFLRAERSGYGSGRVYTITYTATDSAGNVATASVTVNVPHDMK